MAKTNITRMFPNWADVNSIEKGSNICVTVRVLRLAQDLVGKFSRSWFRNTSTKVVKGVVVVERFLLGLSEVIVY